ncbi:MULTISPECIES: sigma 54-interacting transcriptional regulator [unclassified Desulfovibrio]|uniref:sigma-54 interaction domain-containing protein n=1 Tax=unclassified Desulfovibrio TaxID=2593640 RepID=UPI0013EC51B6|nr:MULTISPECIES: sigma 54-interacting transcriptional regulator [unclassified Desulfovibrio]
MPKPLAAVPGSAPLAPASQLALLLELTALVNSAGDVAESLERALALMATHLPIIHAMVTLVDPKSGEIRTSAAYGLNPAERRRGRYLQGEGVTGRVIASGRAMCVCDAGSEPLFLNKTRSRDLTRERVSFLCVPIRLHDQVVGALSVDQHSTDAGTLEDELHLLQVIAALLAHTALESQDRMAEAAPPRARPAGFVGNSEAMHAVYAQIAQVGPSPATVLLQGESGTGKELAARAIHAASPRAAGPFVSLNCAALPESLMESELFGHERGAFTGAAQTRKGRFELAAGGTLFLDEVGELAPATQAKLLRVLQERAFERLGGMETLRADVRIITATNRDLEQMVEAGAFRRDLFYRLNVFPLCLPPLRERPEDILPLAAHFLGRFAGGGRGPAHLSLAVMDMLQRYAWPGNVRELQNVMERAALLLGPERVVLPQHLPPALHGGAAPGSGDGRPAAPPPPGSLAGRLEEVERASIVEALDACAGHMGKAAAALGLTERVMALRLKKYGLSYKTFRQGKRPLS